jgi:hypothetical protein
MSQLQQCPDGFVHAPQFKPETPQHANRKIKQNNGMTNDE